MDEKLLERLVAFLEQRPGQLVSWQTVARAVESSPSNVEDCLRSAVERGVSRPPFRNVRRPWFHARGVRWGGVRDRLALLEAPDPVALEAAVLDERFHEADRIMASLGLGPPKLPETPPVLCWKDERALSEGAAAWYLRNLLTDSARQAREGLIWRDATLAVDPGLSDASCRAFARWIATAKLSSSLKITIPTRKESAVDALGFMRREGVMKRQLSHIRGMAGAQRDVNLAVVSAFPLRIPDVRVVGSTLAYVRWGHRLREDFRAVFQNLLPRDWDALVERHWPRGDDPSGDAESWAGEMAEIIDRAIRDGRVIGGLRFRRCYLENPLARKALAGVEIKIDGRSTGIEELGVDDVGVEQQIRFARRGEGRRLRQPGELPALPPMMPYGTFTRRCRELGLRPFHETDGGSLYALLDAGRFRLRVHHLGYGAGYGGRRPVQVIGFDVDVPQNSSEGVNGVRGGLVTAAVGTAYPGLNVGQAQLRGLENLPAEVMHHVVEILEQLFAESPSVAAWEPTLVRERLMGFARESGAKEFRLVTAPESAGAMLDELQPETAVVQRLSAYATICVSLGVEALTLVVREKVGSGRGQRAALWKTLYEGPPAALSEALGDFHDVLTTAPYQLQAGSFFVWDRIGLSALEAEIDRVSRALKEGLDVRAQVDGDGDQVLKIAEPKPTQALKKELVHFARSCRVKVFDVFVDDEVVSPRVKGKKLTAMGTVIRQHLEGGATKRVRPADSEGVVETAELRF